MLEESEKMRKIGSFTEDEIRSVAGYEAAEEDGDIVFRAANLISSEMDDFEGVELEPDIEE